MKVLKWIFYGICLLLLLVGIGVMVFAFQPNLTARLADTLQKKFASEEPEEGDEPSDSAEDGQEIPSGEEPAEGETTPGEVHANEDPPIQEIPPGPVQIDFVNVTNNVISDKGYEPTKENRLEIGEDESRNLRSSLGHGELGADISFDETLYPYYGMLDETSRRIYRQIYANAMKSNTSFIPIVTVGVHQLKDIFTAVYNDHPAIFWLDAAYACKYERNGNLVEIELQFYHMDGRLEDAKRNFNANVSTILSGMPEDGTAFQKELYLHNALLNHVEYDLNADMHQSAYSALVGRRSVCAGYARAFQYLLQQAKIPAYFCTGYAGELHAWNIVKLGDDYYNVDPTWNDTNPTTFNFFNKTDEEFSPTHIRQDLSVKLPECKGTTYRYTGGGTASANTPPPPTIVDFRRTLAQTGIPESAVLSSLEAYYDDCYQQISDKGTGVITFQNAVTKELWQDVYFAYHRNDYRDGYLDQIFEDIDAATYNIHLVGEELRDGRYLIMHTIVIQ